MYSEVRRRSQQLEIYSSKHARSLRDELCGFLKFYPVSVMVSSALFSLVPFSAD